MSGRDNTDADVIEFTISLKGGFGTGEDRSRESALARPFRPLAEYGKPVGRVNFIFTDPEGLPSSVVGSLCFTPGNRLLFYPGLATRKMSWYTEGGEKRLGPSASVIDHLTLESDFRTWHFTLLDSQAQKTARVPGLKTNEIHGGAYYWFGLSIQGPAVLQQTPEKQVILFPTPTTDVERRMSEFQLAVDEAEWHLLHLLPANLAEASFIHFDFIIDPTSGVPVNKLPSYRPIAPPALEFPVEAPEKVPIRAHPVRVPSFPATVHVMLSRRKGVLVDDAIFTSVSGRTPLDSKP